MRYPDRLAMDHLACAHRVDVVPLDVFLPNVDDQDDVTPLRSALTTT